MEKRFQNIVAFGDSIIKGVIAEDDGNGNCTKYRISENNATSICSRKFEMTPYNFGKFGSIVTCGEKIIDKNLHKLSENDIVLIEYGGNDCDKMWMEVAENPEAEHLAKTPLPIFAETYRRIIKKIKETGATIIALTMPPVDTNAYFRHITKQMTPTQKDNVKKWLYDDIGVIALWHEMYNQEIIRIACLENVEIANIYQPFIDMMNYRRLFCCDGIHPNQMGQEIIAKRIIEKVETM